MASSSKEKDTKIEKKDATGSDKSTRESSTGSGGQILDGRIFEADGQAALSSEEKAETKEFQISLRKYNNLAKKMRKDALKKERDELNQSEKSPKVRYYEGSRMERIKIVDAEAKLMEEMEK